MLRTKREKKGHSLKVINGKKGEGGAMIREQELTYVHTRSGREGKTAEDMSRGEVVSAKKSGSRRFANKKRVGDLPLPVRFPKSLSLCKPTVSDVGRRQKKILDIFARSEPPNVRIASARRLWNVKKGGRVFYFVRANASKNDMSRDIYQTFLGFCWGGSGLACCRPLNFCETFSLVTSPRFPNDQRAFKKLCG